MDDDLVAWLGPVAREVPAEKLEAIEAAWVVLQARWPGPDWVDTRERALVAAVQVVMDEVPAEELGARWAQAVAVEVQAREALTGAIAALRALDPRRSEESIAAEVGTSRLTVRKSLAKSSSKDRGGKGA